MSNKTNKGTANESLVVAFQSFNGVFLAKISNLQGKATHAFGATKCKAQLNALVNYQTKYATAKTLLS